MSVVFNGSASYAITSGFSVAGTSPHTFVSWANLSVASTSDVVYWHHNDGTDNNSTRIGFDNITPVILFYSTIAGTQTLFTQALSGLNTWVHLALVIDGTNMVSYVNGVQVDSRAFNPSTRSLAFDEIDIGDGGTQLGQDAMIFTSALSANEIRACMNGRAPKTQLANLLGWWPMFGDTPTIDYSGHGHTLVPTGGTPAKGTSFPAVQYGRQLRPLAMRNAVNNPPTITATGTTQTTGSASMTSAASIPATGTTQTTGSAAMTKAASIPASGLTQTTGSAAMSAAASIPAAGTTQTTGAATMTASAPLAASGTTQTTGSAVMSIIIPITATGLTQTTGAVGFAGVVIATGLTKTTGTATMTAKANLTATGLTQTFGTATFTAGAGPSRPGSPDGFTSRRYLGAFGARRRLRG